MAPIWPLLRVGVWLLVKWGLVELAYSVIRERRRNIRNYVSRTEENRARIEKSGGPIRIPAAERDGDLPLATLPSGSWRWRVEKRPFGAWTVHFIDDSDASQRMVAGCDSAPVEADLPELLEQVSLRQWRQGDRIWCLELAGNVATASVPHSSWARHAEHPFVWMHFDDPDTVDELPWKGLGRVSHEELRAWFETQLEVRQQPAP